MHIEPHPITHIIKQRILVYVECNSNTDVKAQKLVGKNTSALLTILLDKVGFLFHCCTVHLQVPETVYILYTIYILYTYCIHTYYI